MLSGRSAFPGMNLLKIEVFLWWMSFAPPYLVLTQRLPHPAALCPHLSSHGWLRGGTSHVLVLLRSASTRGNKIPSEIPSGSINDCINVFVT